MWQEINSPTTSYTQQQSVAPYYDGENTYDVIDSGSIGYFYDEIFGTSWSDVDNNSSIWSTQSGLVPGETITILAGSSSGLLLVLTYAEDQITTISSDSGPDTASWQTQSSITTEWSENG